MHEKSSLFSLWNLFLSFFPPFFLSSFLLPFFSRLSERRNRNKKFFYIFKASPRGFPKVLPFSWPFTLAWRRVDLFPVAHRQVKWRTPKRFTLNQRLTNCISRKEHRHRKLVWQVPGEQKKRIILIGHVLLVKGVSITPH